MPRVAVVNEMQSADVGTHTGGPSDSPSGSLEQLWWSPAVPRRFLCRRVRLLIYLVNGSAYSLNRANFNSLNRAAGPTNVRDPLAPGRRPKPPTGLPDDRLGIHAG